jgi:hypothetical protein
VATEFYYPDNMEIGMFIVHTLTKYVMNLLFHLRGQSGYFFISKICSNQVLLGAIIKICAVCELGIR